MTEARGGTAHRAGIVMTGNLSVVIVEDQVVLRDHIVDLMVERNIDVVAAVGTVADGEQAVLRLRPDVAIIDNGLPDGRGIDLCGRIRRSTPDAALILHTGLISVDEEREVVRIGVLAVVLKKIRSDELLDLLETLKPGRGDAPR